MRAIIITDNITDEEWTGPADEIGATLRYWHGQEAEQNAEVAAVIAALEDAITRREPLQDFTSYLNVTITSGDQ